MSNLGKTLNLEPTAEFWMGQILDNYKNLNLFWYLNLKFESSGCLQKQFLSSSSNIVMLFNPFLLFKCKTIIS